MPCARLFQWNKFSGLFLMLSKFSIFKISWINNSEFRNFKFDFFRLIQILVHDASNHHAIIISIPHCWISNFHSFHDSKFQIVTFMMNSQCHFSHPLAKWFQRSQIIFMSIVQIFLRDFYVSITLQNKNSFEQLNTFLVINYAESSRFLQYSEFDLYKLNKI